MLIKRLRELKKYKKGDEDDLKNEINEQGGLEKGDMPALVISALITIIPACLIALGVIVVLALWVFGII